MTTYGITSTGFVIKPQQQILADIEAAQLATIDPALDVSADQPVGQINGIFSRALSELWEIAQVAYNGFDRDRAEGSSLQSLGKLMGATKDDATYAKCLCTITTTGALVLQTDVNYAQLDTDPSVQFTPAVNFTAPGAGTYTGVVFRAQTAGPVSAPANHLTVIATPVVGWVGVNNTNDASGGLPADGDPALRLKMDQELAKTGTTTVDALRADVLGLNDTVTDPAFTKIVSCEVFENIGDFIDANGLPPHSFEVLVYDGATPGPVNDNLIAQAIWDGKAQGIQPYGSGTDSGTAIDGQGNSHTVPFSRVTTKDVYLTFTLTAGPLYIGDTLFKTKFADYANSAWAQAGNGSDVIRAQLIALAFLIQSGILDVPDLKLGFAPSPSGTANLAIGPRELARFDSANITVL